jgi:hypothetical protein
VLRPTLSWFVVCLSSTAWAATDAQPVGRITAPRPDDRLSGPLSDFSCECIDDAG